jgi:hypothetical protein
MHLIKHYTIIIPQYKFSYEKYVFINSLYTGTIHLWIVGEIILLSCAIHRRRDIFL